MPKNAKSYNCFLNFIDKFSPGGFMGINPDDPLMADIEMMMEKNNQFLFICDLIELKILFTSKRSTQMLGINPLEISPYHFFEGTHPDDIQRHSLGRAKLLRMAHDIFIREGGHALISTNFRIRNAKSGYSNLLFQCYLFYSVIPHKTVYLLQVHTNIEWFKKIKYGYHFYLANDLSNFKYPDEQLLMIGNIFTDREFEILKLISSGLSSDEIAKKLFLSPHTINTHRRIILKKSGKAYISELIYELQERGIL